MSATNEVEFTSFARSRLPALYRSALFLCGDPHQAEDLAQEALTRVYLVWGTRRIDDPVAYTNKTLLRAFLSLRRRRSYGEYPTETIPEATSPSVDVALRVDLQSALALLKPIDRAIVVMRHLEGMPVAAVAQAVGRSPENVRVRSMRALAQMKVALVTDGDTSFVEMNYDR